MWGWLAKRLPNFLWWDILRATRTVRARGIVTPWVRRVDNYGHAITVFSPGFVYWVTLRIVG